MCIYLRFFVVFLFFLCTFFAFFASSDRRRRYNRYRDNIGYPRYGESYNIGDNHVYKPILLKKLIVLPNRQILGIGSIPYVIGLVVIKYTQS